MNGDGKTKRGMPVRRIVALAWVALGVVLAAVVLYPVTLCVSRWFIAAAVVALWGGGVFLAWRRRWLGRAVLAAGLLAVLFAVAPGRPPDHARLRDAYVRELRGYEGVPYVWGGENGLGIDCSGLVRRALIVSLVKTAVSTANPAALRAGLDLWWHDCSARALGERYRGNTSFVRDASSINALPAAAAAPGDLAVSANGVHVLACLGNGEWIQAEPGLGKVFMQRAPKTDGVWFNAPVRIMRWCVLAPAADSATPGQEKSRDTGQLRMQP